MRKLITRILLLLVAASVLQLTLVPRLRKMKDVRRFNACLAHAPDVVFFCDSVNGWIDPEDTDVRGVSTMLDDLLDDATVGAVTRGAYHAEVYEAFVDLLLSRELRPEAVVIPINLRSFSPEWDLKPAYQFEVAKRQIRDADAPFRLALNPLLRTLHLVEDAPISQLEYKNAPVYRGESIAGLVRDFDNPAYEDVTPEHTRNKFIFHYMYDLSPEHRKLAALRRISRKATDAGLRVLFYITPIDVETGERHLPGEFRARVEANVRTILDGLAEHRPEVIDLATALAAGDFSWHRYPNEHLRERGRLFVAGQLAGVLRAAARLQQEGSAGPASAGSPGSPSPAGG